MLKQKRNAKPIRMNVHVRSSHSLAVLLLASAVVDSQSFIRWNVIHAFWNPRWVSGCNCGLPPPRRQFAEGEREKVEGKANESRANVFLSVHDHRVVAFECVYSVSLVCCGCFIAVPTSSERRWFGAEDFNLDVFVYVISMSSIQHPQWITTATTTGGANKCPRGWHEIDQILNFKTYCLKWKDSKWSIWSSENLSLFGAAEVVF